MTLTFQFSIEDDRRVTDRSWEELQDAIDEFVEVVDTKTIFTTPIDQTIIYNREVEVRPSMYFE
ncbi:hypothetical protein [Nocardioides sp. Arc9.136]|uniref:hypothetical protein n=1 Tax=Nocardioides sp. Arc9.136 TaxID=2996826 RepID=UPI0026650A5B|nr:hypothetical protein [Nocardioides sp. Arc9.136]WKN47140.1 hypothetical protein OSR43_13940 [Nocardioides sp. Arc9.136]